MFSLIIKEGEVSERGNLEVLKEFRFPNNKTFPKSYQDFVEKYGYGLLMGLFIIYIPMDGYGDSWEVRKDEIINTYIEDVNNDDIWFELEPDGSVDLVKRWVPFASSENGHYLFWDIENGEKEEFDIYITDFRGLGVRKVASSMYELIENVTSPSKFKSVLPFSQIPLGPTFIPWKRS